MLTFDKLYEFVRQHVPDGEVTRDETASPAAVIIPAEHILPLCRVLHSDPATYFDSLSCVTGLDNGAEAGSMEVAYNLYSIPFNHHLMIRISLPRENPAVDSVSSVWKTANWHEREIFDLFGIHFRNHPDLRRILMPADWEGFPLRKDYKNVGTYRGIRFDY